MNILLCCGGGFSSSLLVEKMKKSAKEKNVPVELIQPTHYGTCNGAEVLKFALHYLN